MAPRVHSVVVATEAPAMVRRVHVPLGSRSYDVRIGAGGVARVATELARLDRRLCIITDTRLHRLWWPRLAIALRRLQGHASVPITVVPGEAAKTPAHVARVQRAMRRQGVDRETVVVAFGGGAVSDLAGFAAATYMRGIDWVAVPTTLLAMVDAAVGGKTGVDLDGVKNLVGAFHQPRVVIADTTFLRTLPPRQRQSGLGEVVKYAMIADPALFRALEREGRAWRRPRPQQDATIVARCCRIKARFVASDEREGGVRAALNFGHTIGHALEGDGRSGLLHGEAVGLGMLAATAIASACGVAPPSIRPRLARVLESLGLPVVWARGRGVSGLRHAWRSDKKARGGRPRFVLTPAIGAFSLAHEVSDAVIQAALRTITPPTRLRSHSPLARTTTARGES